MSLFTKIKNFLALISGFALIALAYRCLKDKPLPDEPDFPKAAEKAEAVEKVSQLKEELEKLQKSEAAYTDSDIEKKFNK